MSFNYAQLMYEAVSLIGDIETFGYDDLARKFHDAIHAIGQEGFERANGEAIRHREIAQLEAMWSNG